MACSGLGDSATARLDHRRSDGSPQEGAQVRVVAEHFTLDASDRDSYLCLLLQSSPHPGDLFLLFQ